MYSNIIYLDFDGVLDDITSRVLDNIAGKVLDDVADKLLDDIVGRVLDDSKILDIIIDIC
ncbi:6438_t:CDS:2 [Funneliformis mosseae]|uniref:6438_t:CDS:1 n=1 Tax=Funneliformis mosseae TaxID=27381 RepID=A0A9N9CFG8_FUNMO|nr:6438_t:CDS:2 [Funneliformis mosseae]